MLSWNNILFCSHYRPFPLSEFCLNLSGFPHAQYVQPHTGHTQSHPTAICTHTHPMLAADIVSPGVHIASQTANARLAAPNMHSANQRLSFLAQYESPNHQCQAEQSREYHNPEAHVLDLSLKFNDSIMLVSQ